MADDNGESAAGGLLQSLRSRARAAGAPFWKRAGVAIAGGLGLLLVLLYLRGTLGSDTVAPGRVPLAPEVSPPGGGTALVEKREIDDVLEWPGTIRPRREARVAARVMARILEIKAEVGSAVRAGDVLAALDDRDVRARADQAKAALRGAKARAVQAQAEHARVKGLYENQASTRRDYEAAEARAKALQAEADQAQSAVREAEVQLAETSVRAPFDSLVAEKLVDAGDTAVPGAPLFVLHDPARLRLEAPVPETRAHPLKVGMELRVRVDSQDADVAARIEEISPAADPRSRTFLVKAALPETIGLRSGMFGRLLLPCGRRVALLVPASAVTRSGQIESVRVVEGSEFRVRHVRTGKRHREFVEVLSGLREGEKVRVP